MEASATTRAQTSWKAGMRYQYRALPTSTSMTGNFTSACPTTGRYEPDPERLMAIVLKSTPVKPRTVGSATNPVWTLLITAARWCSSFPVTSSSPSIPKASPMSVWRPCVVKTVLARIHCYRIPAYLTLKCHTQTFFPCNAVLRELLCGRV